MVGVVVVVVVVVAAAVPTAVVAVVFSSATSSLFETARFKFRECSEFMLDLRAISLNES